MMQITTNLPCCFLAWCAAIIAVAFSPTPSTAQTATATPGSQQSIPASPSNASSQIQRNDATWRRLLKDTLEGWVIQIGVPHKTVIVPGLPPSTSGDGKKGTPIGDTDPLEIFSIDQVDSEPVLHVSGQVFGGLSTEETFGDYHLSLQYKWGKKKWEPRLQRKRDSGVLIHCTGPQGVIWGAWMRSVECQVQETDAGDLYALAGTSVCVPVGSGKKNAKRFQPDGDLRCFGAGAKRKNGGSAKRSENHETEGWNQVDIIAVGDQAIYFINGKRVMQFQNAKIGSQESGVPLTGGHIQIQSEGAEVFYRRIKIRDLNRLPKSDQLETKGLGVAP